MAETATILYNLNMGRTDNVLVKASSKKGLSEIKVVDAFDAALSMFKDGLKSRPDRANTRQVIYYMTDSNPKINLDRLNQFKEGQGVIIVNNFLEKGEAARAGLKALASDGYYISNVNNVASLHSFCEANCFCKAEKNEYGGSESSGVCYTLCSVGFKDC